MPLLTILPDDDITKFEQPPEFTAEERKHFFTLPQWAEGIVATLQTPTSKIGFILQLGYFRATKKFYTTLTFHQADIQFVARRLSAEDVGQLETYAKTTSHRHRIIIRDKLRYSPFSATTEAMLTKEVEFLLSKQMRLKDIFGTLLQYMEERRRRFRVITRLGAGFFLNVAAGYLFAIYVSPNPITLTNNALFCIVCLYAAYLFEQAAEQQK